MSENNTTSAPRLLLFGGTGSVGSAIFRRFHSGGWKVVVVSRTKGDGEDRLQWDPIAIVQDLDTHEQLAATGPFDAVCWAQGLNLNDSVYDFDCCRHEAAYGANVLYILKSLNVLLARNLLRSPARLCVISSIWQNLARQTKLSYCVTKAALEGLVLSAAADLARDGHVINAVLPGVLDTPMTRANLNPEQVHKVERATLFGRLPQLDEVASCVYGLCRPEMSAVTGQFISVDLGYSRVRVI